MIGKPIYKKQPRHGVNLTILLSNPSATCYIEQYPRDYAVIDKYHLSQNPYAIHILENNMDNIHWPSLMRNRNALRLLEKNMDKMDWHAWYDLSFNPDSIRLFEKIYSGHYSHSAIDDNGFWYLLSRNPNAIHLLEKNMDKVCWRNLSTNPNAIHLLESNLDKVDWHDLASNPKGVPLLEKNPDKIDWDLLAFNTSDEAIDLLEKNMDKINWKELSYNDNPKAIRLIERNLDKVIGSFLSSNPSAVSILEKNPDKIDWWTLSANPNAIHLLLDFDYMRMREVSMNFGFELLKYVFDPQRIERMALANGIEFADYLDALDL